METNLETIEAEKKIFSKEIMRGQLAKLKRRNKSPNN